MHSGRRHSAIWGLASHTHLRPLVSIYSPRQPLPAGEASFIVRRALEETNSPAAAPKGGAGPSQPPCSPADPEQPQLSQLEDLPQGQPLPLHASYFPYSLPYRMEFFHECHALVSSACCP
jgi:hypothetical protein